MKRGCECGKAVAGRSDAPSRVAQTTTRRRSIDFFDVNGISDLKSGMVDEYGHHPNDNSKFFE
jgi:hypothetical protein